MVQFLWYYIARGLIGLLIVVGNTTVIYLIITRKRLHKITNWFILSLSCADLCVGSFLIPVNYICTFGAFQCNSNALKVSHSIFLYVSLGNLCILTVDRYVAIVRPLEYRLIITGRRVVILISLAWVLPLMGALAPSIWLWISTRKAGTAYRIFYVSILCIFEILPCFLMALVYLHIILISRRHSQEDERQQRQLVFNYNDSSCVNGSRPKREKSAFCATLFVVLLFILTWIISAYRTFCVSVLSRCRVQSLTILISRIMMLSHSGLNPFIWALLKKDIQLEFRKLLGCYRGRRTRRRARYNSNSSNTLSSALSVHFQGLRSLSNDSTLLEAMDFLPEQVTYCESAL